MLRLMILVYEENILKDMKIVRDESCSIFSSSA